MRYLRMLSNSVIAAGLASAYLAVLFLQVNPAIPIDAGTLTPLALTIGASYGAILTIAFYALIMFRQILTVEALSPGWLSVRVMSWLCAIAAVTGATIMWLNLNGFGPVLDAPTTARMAVGAGLVSVAALVFLLIGLSHLGRRAGRMSATILSITMFASVAAPLLARGPGHVVAGPAKPTMPHADLNAERAGARVTMLMLDGASLDAISPAVAAGRLPNIGRIFDQGAVLHLATLRPTQAEPVWSTIATGRLPMNNGIRSAVLYRAPGGVPLLMLPDYCFAQALVRVGVLGEEPHTAADLSARPIWSILSDLGVRVGIIGWPLTHPAPEVNGFLVSDTFHRLLDSGVALEESKGLWPPSRFADASAALAVPAAPDPVSLVSSMGAPQPRNDYDVGRDPAPVVADRVHLQLLNAFGPRSRFLAARFPGIDAVGHLFLRYADPSAFGDVSEDELRQFGGVLNQYYGFVDTLVGREMEKLDPDDLLLVVSAFGMEPLSPSKRLLEMAVGNPQISGTHERAPDGFVLAFGSSVAPGRPARAALVDVTPTVLYFLGLPVGADMEGLARTDIFKQSFTAENPVTFIPSYGR
ncbi:MAG: alkaline phosphatase family protein [Vicinamibacterales bacterium]